MVIVFWGKEPCCDTRLGQHVKVHAENTWVDGGSDLKSELQLSTHVICWKPAAKCVADDPVPRRK